MSATLIKMKYMPGINRKLFMCLMAARWAVLKIDKTQMG
jgi:hypothetical protein